MKKIAIGHAIILCLTMLLILLTLLGGVNSISKLLNNYETFSFLFNLVALFLVCGFYLYFVFALLANKEHLGIAFLSFGIVIIYFVLSLFTEAPQFIISIRDFLSKILVILTLDMAVLSVKTQSPFHDTYKKILVLITSAIYFTCLFAKINIAENIMNCILYAGFLGSNEGASLLYNILMTLSCLCLLGILLNPVVAYLTSDLNTASSPISQKAFEAFQQQNSAQAVMNHSASQAASTLTTSQVPSEANAPTEPTPEPQNNQQVCNLNAQNVSPQLAFLLQQEDHDNNK